MNTTAQMLGQAPDWNFKPMGLDPAQWQSGAAAGLALVDPAQWLQWQQSYMADLQAGPKLDDAFHDKRFAGKPWHEQEAFAQMAAWYTLHARHLDELKNLIKLPPHEAQQFSFALEQWLAAMAPSNFLAFNPEAIEKIRQTNGESLQHGLANLLADLHKGRISQTDETVFEVGTNVATTVGDVVYENDFIQLIQYRPLTAKVAQRPFLIVPPCINKFYILDLQPENSFVRYAVEQGNTVFLVSWRNPQAGELDHAGWDDYLREGPIAAIHAVQGITGAPDVNALGFCVGGTLLSAALSALAAKGEEPVASLTLLTTLLDFSDPGILGVYIDEGQVALREASIGAGGLMPARDLSSSFSSLRPNDLIWNYVVSNYLKGQAPPAFDLLYWNSDSTNLPGPMFVHYLRRLYMENALAQGKLDSLGVKLDLKKVNLPTYVLASREDHIVPWKSAYASARCLGARNIRFTLAASGHIAGVINPASKNKRNYWSAKGMPANADDWLGKAQEVPGSWWSDWSAWLASHAGGSKVAPKKSGSRKYPVIEPAPGRYVKVRAV